MSRSRSRSRDPSSQAPPSALSSTARGGLGGLGGLGNLTSEGRPSLELSKLEEEKNVVEHNETAK